MIPLLNDIETQNRQANEYNIWILRGITALGQTMSFLRLELEKIPRSSEQTNGKRNWKFNLDVGGAAAAEVMLRWEFAESLVCLCHRIWMGHSFSRPLLDYVSNFTLPRR